jgi:hypothetical protein
MTEITINRSAHKISVWLDRDYPTQEAMLIEAKAAIQRKLVRIKQGDDTLEDALWPPF